MSTEIPVPVTVDPENGRWSVEGIPMVLVPRHMITNNLAAAEERLGHNGSANLIRDAGYRSAQQWCTQQRGFHGFSPDRVVAHYLEQLGNRGWGRFRIEEHTGERIRVTLRHSALADRTTGNGTGTCYMFAAWLEGAFDFAAAETGRPRWFAFTETGCRSTGAPHCTFHGKPVEQH
ncbi:4-vinyl reductase [Sciscionella sediminilitoris]|uniref:4-vinyl reductase n=1 Tax=Sciscionella sediminilitoris TaxID=1445613 RepID=UPI0004DEEABB|nr:4-vinyl reductase [Sciscionella sp. SE31]